MAQPPPPSKFLQLVQEEMRQQQSTLASEDVIPTDVGIRAHNAAVAHLEACFEMLDSEEENGDTPVEVATMAPFCGCSDCIVREVLFAAFPILSGGKAFDEPVADHSDG